jgi:iron complex outermembrane receptor protein
VRRLGGRNNGSRGYNWEDAILNAMSTNHDLSFSKSTDNSYFYWCIKYRRYCKQNRFRQIYICFEQFNDFWSALKVDTKVIYSSLRDEAALVTNNVGFIGNLIGAAMYWNPTDRLNMQMEVLMYDLMDPQDSNTFLNPAKLSKTYTDYTNTNKLLASINQL